MINQDGECKTLTDKGISHKKAKFMNSDAQTDRLIHRQPDRQIDRQTDQQTVKGIMINRDRQCKTLTDKSKSNKNAEFMNSE